MHLMERLKAPFEPISAAQRLADTKAVEFKEKNNDKPTDEEYLRSLTELRRRGTDHMIKNARSKA